MRDCRKKISVLVDLSVLRNGVRTLDVQVEKKIRWGDQDYAVPVAGWEPKPDGQPNEVWRRRQIECLPAIARLAREGVIVCYSYSELRFEEMWGEKGMIGSFGDLFAEVNIKRCPPAVERSRFSRKADFREYLKKETLVEFCDFLLRIDPSILKETPELWNALPAFEQENLAQLERFKVLCRRLTRNHYSDAFHLWTAEASGLDYFLMVDKKFSNAVQNNHDFDFRCRPVSPENLLSALG